jgi:signal peptidase
MHVPSVLKRIWGIFTGAVVAVIVVMAILLVGVRIVGIHPYTVLSGSMEPTYHVGSMIYVKKLPASELGEGDPVTFYLSGSTVATHRIVEVVIDPNYPDVRLFRTQGDANDVPDANLLSPDKVIGKPLFTVPYLGYFSNYIQHQPGRSVALGCCTVLLLAVILPSIWVKKPKDEEQKPDEPADEQDTDA